MTFCTLETPAATAWAEEARGSVEWATDTPGDTYWPPDSETWAAWTDGSWWLDHDGALVGWTDWPPSWGQAPTVEPCSCLADGAYLTDEQGNPLTDESGLLLLYD
jgi:hypothetical protein